MSQAKEMLETAVRNSGDMLEAQTANLRALFPEVFADGKFDFDNRGLSVCDLIPSVT